MAFVVKLCAHSSKVPRILDKSSVNTCSRTFIGFKTFSSSIPFPKPATFNNASTVILNCTKQASSRCNNGNTLSTVRTFYSRSQQKYWVFQGKCSRRIFHTSALKRCAKEVGKNGNKPIVPKLSEVKRLFALAKPEKWNLICAICLLFISSAVTMSVPYGIGKVIDIIYTQSKDQDSDEMVKKLQNFCTLLFCVFIIGGAANFGRVYLMRASGNRIINRLRETTFSSIVRQEMAFFDKNKTGELINRLSTDTSMVGSSVTQNISDGLRSVMQAIGGVTMMVYMSPKLAGTAIFVVPPVFLVSRFYGRYLRTLTKKVQDALAVSTQVAEERIGNMRTVRAFAGEEREEKQYNDKINTVLQLGYKDALASAGFWAFTGMSGNMMILAIIYRGGMMMHGDLITVGELSSFLMYAAFSGVSLGGLTTFYSELMRGLGASTRLFQLQGRHPAIPLHDGLTPEEPIQGDIEFCDVQFSYPSRSDIGILNGFDLHVPWGQVLALVGSSGSGKSTIASLLLRFYDPCQGSVHVDGRDIRTYSPHWLRQQMGIVSQEPVLFSNSIAENIAYGAHDPSTVTKEQIIKAAKQANAYRFIKTFPQGLDTLVGERGIMLSGGQKQRIAIARAIIKDPKILLLDEATSALDAESEYLVQEALERVMNGRTVITIAHRLSTIKNAHQIAVLDHGVIVEKGTYAQLMDIEDGTFRKLVERQTIVNS